MIVWQVLVCLAVFAGLLTFLNVLARRHMLFPWRVFTALGLGILFGWAFHLFFIMNSAEHTESMMWINLVGDIYVTLLKMIIFPLIIVSITNAFLNISGKQNIGKTSVSIISFLLLTTAISAVIGIVIALGFNLQAPSIEVGDVAQATSAIEAKADTATTHITQKILQFVPVNPFLELTGNRSSSTIAVVILSAFFAIAAMQLGKKKPESLETIKSIIKALHDVVMRMMTLILRLTPYGVLALSTNMVASSNFAEIMQLGKFVVVSYIGLFAILAVHMAFIIFAGLNPITYLRKTLPVFILSFTSRSSASVIAPNIETQKEALGVDEGTANMAAGFGVAIGQNACAGLYPAMLAIMSLNLIGYNITLALIVKLIVIVTIASFGVAGIGGGATFAAIIVLSMLDLPIGIAGMLIAIEPLIDMGRTAINVSGSVTAGVFNSKMAKMLDTTIYNDPKKVLVISD